MRGWLGLTAVMLVMAPLGPRAWAENQLPVLVGTVTKIVDGDTIDVQLASGPIRVRFHGIDTPERGQPWFGEASQALAALVAHKEVEIEPFEQDRYERLIGIVFVGDMNVNVELVKQGHAWAFRKYMRRSDAQLCADEAVARISKRGVWALPPDQRVAPWEWRRRKSQPEFSDYSEETPAHCVAAIGKG